MIKRIAAAALAAAALAQLAAPQTAGAFVREESNWNPHSLPIQYHVNHSSLPPEISSTGVASVDSGFASWSAPSCTTWTSHDAGDTSAHANQSDSTNVIEWISGSWPSELGDVSVTIGVTTPVWYSGGYFVDADIRFNNVGFAWNTTGARSGSGGRTGVDTQSIATHEEGHFLGLGHTPVASAIMYASYAGGIKRMLTSDDTAGVCTIYPSGGAIPDAGMTMPGGGDVGTACASDPSVCASGDECACRDTAMTDCFCTHSCSSSAPCPSGSTCQSTSIGSICIPGGGGGTMMGMGATGATCMGGQDCSSGICVSTSSSATSGICSQVCADDCSCPSGYQCVPTTMSGTSVCAPGMGSCGSSGSDGGVTTRDAGGTTAQDASTPDYEAGPAGDDAGSSGGHDGGHMMVMDDGGCGCEVPGHARGEGEGGWAMVALGAAIAAVGARRRKRG